MSDKTSIEWTATVHPDGSVTPGSTWNPVRGCVKVSPGCAHCYAETFAERFRGVPGHPYEQGFDLRLVPEKLSEPLSWKKPRRVFVNSMSDLFQDGVPDDYIDRVFAVMALAPQHTFQVLTKRADRMRQYAVRLSKSIWPLQNVATEMGHSFTWKGLSLLPYPIPNVWLGVSVENQHFADERIPLLLQTLAAVRFISAEPLLEEVDLTPHLEGDTLAAPGPSGFRKGPKLDWVIVGGESGGHRARPFDIEWARSIMAQCRAADVPVFVKQLGATPIASYDDAIQPVRLASRKGDEITEWPVDLRVREYPELDRELTAGAATEALATFFHQKGRKF